MKQCGEAAPTTGTTGGPSSMCRMRRRIMHEPRLMVVVLQNPRLSRLSPPLHCLTHTLLRTPLRCTRRLPTRRRCTGSLCPTPAPCPFYLTPSDTHTHTHMHHQPDLRPYSPRCHPQHHPPLWGPLERRVGRHTSTLTHRHTHTHLLLIEADEEERGRIRGRRMAVLQTWDGQREIRRAGEEGETKAGGGSGICICSETTRKPHTYMHRLMYTMDMSDRCCLLPSS